MVILFEMGQGHRLLGGFLRHKLSFFSEWVLLIFGERWSTFPPQGDGIYFRKFPLVTDWHTFIRIFFIFVSLFVYSSVTKEIITSIVCVCVCLGEAQRTGKRRWKYNGVGFGHDETLEWRHSDSKSTEYPTLLGSGQGNGKQEWSRGQHHQQVEKL